MSNAGPMEQLAATFMVPARSGVYLTRNELLVLARISEASLRFNERKRMMVDILRSAQDADQLVALLERLVEFCVASLAEYQALAAAFPQSAPQLQVWMDKTNATITMLKETQEEIRL